MCISTADKTSSIWCCSKERDRAVRAPGGPFLVRKWMLFPKTESALAETVGGGVLRGQDWLPGRTKH